MWVVTDCCDMNKVGIAEPPAIVVPEAAQSPIPRQEHSCNDASQPCEDGLTAHVGDKNCSSTEQGKPEDQPNTTSENPDPSINQLNTVEMQNTNNV